MQIRKLIVSSFKRVIRYDSCAGPGIFVRWGEGGGPGPSGIKSSDNVFLFVFLVLNLFYKSPVVTFKENYYLLRFQWGWNIFQEGGGDPTFYRGVQLPFSL